MSTLKSKIEEDTKAALRAGEKSRLTTLRMLLAAIKQREVDERTETTDPLVLQIVERLIKQRRESAEQFASAGRADLEARERAEIDILKAYLPEPLSAAALAALVDEVIAATGASGMKDMGRVMAALRDRAQGRADFTELSGIVKARLAAR